MTVYKVGDKVWIASFSQAREVVVPCPVCYGDKNVIVTLGNGEAVEVECQYCQVGFRGAIGTVKEYIQDARAENVTITRRIVEERAGGDEIEYYTSRCEIKPEMMFDTKAEAQAKADEMMQAYNTNKSPKYKNEKSYSWNAGYHMKAAQKAEAEAVYHKQKAQICKDKSKAAK